MTSSKSVFNRITVIMMIVISGYVFTRAAQAEWTQVYPLPLQATIHAVDYFSTNETIIAAADSGFVYLSLDNGLSWDRTQITTDNWYDVACYGQTGVIVGEFGYTRITPDSGQTWQTPPAFTNANLYAADFLDEIRFVVGGDSGDLWFTENGGSNWTEITTPQMVTIYDIEWVEDSTLYVAAGNNLWKTGNLGGSWTTLRTYNANLSDLLFLNPDTGFACGPDIWTHNRVYRTLDGGASWDSVTNVYHYPIAICAQNAEDVQVVTRNGYLHHSNGSFTGSWTAVPIGGGMSDLTYLPNSNRLIAVGGYDALSMSGPGAVCAYSDDGGVTWEYSLFHQRFPLRSFYFATDLEGWLAGGTPFQEATPRPEVILKTMDGGFSWETKLIKAGGQGLSDIQFFDNLTGVASGHSHLYRTTDGGDSWQAQTAGFVTHLSLVDNLQGWYCGLVTIKFTDNAGLSWTPQSVPSPTDYLFSIDFVDDQHGWASGYNYSPYRGIILVTSDGGTNWDYDYEGSANENVRDIDMWDAQNGTAVSTNGLILRKLTGSPDWDTLSAPGIEWLNSVVYQDSTHIWAASGGGDVIYSTDGGASWLVDTVFSGYGINDIYVRGDYRYLAMSNGEIFFTDSAPTPVIDYPGTSVKPTSFTLSKPYPNPFNPVTKLGFTLPARSYVTLSVFDVSGKRIWDLVQGWRQAGLHEVTFKGSHLASGIYIYRLQAGKFRGSGKMVLIK